MQPTHSVTGLADVNYDASCNQQYAVQQPIVAERDYSVAVAGCI